ncbi:hypothetical protein J6590_073087 [Homalodisca vitripennis]|nr:hypothetical protein J6590_073087 [Homalodisca vitripennis]
MQIAAAVFYTCSQVYSPSVCQVYRKSATEDAPQLPQGYLKHKHCREDITACKNLMRREPSSGTFRRYHRSGDKVVAPSICEERAGLDEGEQSKSVLYNQIFPLLKRRMGWIIQV